MTVITAVLLLFLAFLTHQVWVECCDKKITARTNLYLFDNHALLKHVYQLKTASSSVICGRDCSFDSNCASFNYHTSSQVCELNNVTGDHSPTDFMQLQGSAYYDGTLRYSSCQMWYKAGHRDSGIYIIYHDLTGIQVYCDMETDGGGWIVIQRRQDGSVDFYRDWADYKTGFGNLTAEFWLGLDALRSLTTSGQWQLKVQIEDWEGEKAWAVYEVFAVSGDKYTLSVSSYNTDSTAGNSFEHQNGQQFTTRDNDNDRREESGANCAVRHEGAWWFRSCFYSHLNGKYYHQARVPYAQGLQWNPWKSNYYSLKKCSMAIKEVA